MIVHSKIRMLPHLEFALGKCSVCGRTVIIQWHDTSTGARYGTCCLGAALHAEGLLSLPETGLRHPTAEESSYLPNH